MKINRNCSSENVRHRISVLFLRIALLVLVTALFEIAFSTVQAAQEMEKSNTDYLSESWENEKYSVRYQADAGGKWIYCPALHTACANVFDGGYVQVFSNISVSGIANITKNVTITSFDTSNPCVYYVNLKSHPYIISVASTGSLTLENIILDGGGDEGYYAGYPLVLVQGGSLTMESGAVIRNNDNVNVQEVSNSKYPGGGGVSVVNGGSVTMNEGSFIRNCSAAYGGGAALIGSSDNSFIVNGGIIENCTAARGGGIYINNGTLEIDNAQIRNNSAVKINGLDDVTDFNGQGGGIIIDGDRANVEIKSSCLTGNSSEAFAGAIRCERGNLSLCDSVITENHAGARAGGILTNPLFGTLEIKGSVEIINNTDEEGSPNFELDGNEHETDITPLFKIVGPLSSNVLAGISRSVIPTDKTPVRLLAYPKEGYVISRDDLLQCISDNTEYAVVLVPGGEEYNNNMVMALTALTVSIEENEIDLELGGAFATGSVETEDLQAGRANAKKGFKSAILTPNINNLPQGSIHKGLIWSSSNESAASVDDNGIVTAVGEGETIITVTLRGNENVPAYTDSCKVRVVKSDPYVIPPEPYQLFYTGNEQELVTVGSTTGGTMKYSLEKDGDYSTDIPTGMPEGEYTIWYKVDGDSIYNSTEPHSVKVVIAHVHDWEDWEIDIQPNCVDPGIKKRVCRRCKEEQTEQIPASGHNWENKIIWSKDSTSHWHECAVCKAVSDKSAHIEDGGIITKAPTQTETGIKTYSCTECAYIIRTEIIPIQPVGIISPTKTEPATEITVPAETESATEITVPAETESVTETTAPTKTESVAGTTASEEEDAAETTAPAETESAAETAAPAEEDEKTAAALDESGHPARLQTESYNKSNGTDKTQTENGYETVAPATDDVYAELFKILYMAALSSGAVLYFSVKKHKNR